MLWKTWGSRISGPILALVGFGLIVVNLCIPAGSPVAARALLLGAWITLAAAAFMVLVAQYDVWSAERDRYDTEVSKNARPEIQGEASKFRGGIYGGSRGTKTGIECRTEICFELCVTNCRQVTTNLRDLELDGSLMVCRPEFSNAYGFQSRPHAERILNPELPPGFITILEGRTEMTIRGHSWEDLGYSVDLGALRIDLIDGFGNRHRIKIKSTEKLTVGQDPTDSIIVI